MNKLGQVSLLSLAMGVFFFFLALTFANPLKEVINSTRGASQLDCTNSSISDGTKMTCLFTDIVLPYFIATILGFAGYIMTARVLG